MAVEVGNQVWNCRSDSAVDSDVYLANQLTTGTINMHTIQLLLGETDHAGSSPECSAVPSS